MTNLSPYKVDPERVLLLDVCSGLICGFGGSPYSLGFLIVSLPGTVPFCNCLHTPGVVVDLLFYSVVETPTVNSECMFSQTLPISCSILGLI